MATSFTEFRGKGFWSHDPQIELALLLLSREISSTESRPWLLEARNDWFIQATAGFHGCVWADLDHHIGADPARLAVIQELHGRARMVLLGHFPSISRAEFAGFGLGTRIEFDHDVDIAAFLPASEALDQLLAGRVRWDSLTSPVF